MDGKINEAKNYVMQSRAYYEQCGQEITEDIDNGFKNDAANIFSDSYDEYNKLWCALHNF